MSRLKIMILYVLFENKKTCINPKIDQCSALRSDQTRSSPIESENSARLLLLFFSLALHSHVWFTGGFLPDMRLTTFS